MNSTLGSKCVFLCKKRWGRIVVENTSFWDLQIGWAAPRSESANEAGPFLWGQDGLFVINKVCKTQSGVAEAIHFVRTRPQIVIFDTKTWPSYRTNHYFWHKHVILLPHKSYLLTQMRHPPTAQIITCDAKTWPSYRTNRHFWHKNVTLPPHKSPLLTQTRDPPTAQLITFDTNASPSYRTNRHFLHKNVTLIPHKCQISTNFIGVCGLYYKW